MAFKEPVDLRLITETISGEAVAIPSSAPFVKYLHEVPTFTEGVKICRITPVTKTGAGTGVMTALGVYTGLTTRNYLVEIDTAGGIGTATFRWSIDNGGTWRAEGIPIPDTDPISLELGVQIQFSDGTYSLGDEFSFTAEYWTEVTVVPLASKTFQVNYANGLVTFYATDAGLEALASYEGRGSVVKASDIQQIIDALNQGAVVLGEVDTNDLQVNRGACVNSSGEWIVASSDAAATLALGFCRVVDVLRGEIVLFGPMSGFSGLTPGTLYYLGSDGSPSATPGTVSQRIGRALSSEVVLINCEW